MVQAQDSTDPTGVAGTPGGRNGPGNSVSRARTRKAHAAIEMRLGQATWDEIALALGYPTARAAMVATERALERRLDSEDKAKMRRLCGERYNRLLRAVWPKAMDPDEPEQFVAVTKARELNASYAKLYGLEAPSEVVIHSPAQAEIEAWVARVVQKEVPQVESYDIIDGEVVEDDDAVQAG